MDIVTHLILGLIIAILFGDGNYFVWFVILITSILPDLFCWPGVFLASREIDKETKEKINLANLSHHKNLWRRLAKSKWMYPYHLMHSLWCIILLSILTPWFVFIPYTLHIMLDLVSHSKRNLGIMLFWPLWHKRFGVEKNWFEWYPWNQIPGYK